MTTSAKTYTTRRDSTSLRVAEGQFAAPTTDVRYAARSRVLMS
jgi:hypothetical protein